MVIYSNETQDRSTIRQGFVNVNSQNVSSVTITATAAGRALTQAEWEGYDMFNVAQTSAGTDSIVIPDAMPVGTRLFFHAASAISFNCPTGSSVLLNNVAAAGKGALAINTTGEIFKVSATRVIFTQFSTLGAATNPIPS